MKKLAQAYVRSVAVILALVSVAKLCSALGSARILDMPEALLPLTYRQTLWAVGLLEVSIVAALVLRISQTIKLTITAWLAWNFILYRVAVAALTIGKPCPCLGSITEKLPLKPVTIDRILTGIVLYLFCGSVFFLVALRKRNQSADSAGRQGALTHSEA